MMIKRNKNRILGLFASGVALLFLILGITTGCAGTEQRNVLLPQDAYPNYQQEIARGTTIDLTDIPAPSTPVCLLTEVGAAANGTLGATYNFTSESNIIKTITSISSNDVVLRTEERDISSDGDLTKTTITSIDEDSPIEQEETTQAKKIDSGYAVIYTAPHLAVSNDTNDKTAIDYDTFDSLEVVSSDSIYCFNKEGILVTIIEHATYNNAFTSNHSIFFDTTTGLPTSYSFNYYDTSNKPIGLWNSLGTFKFSNDENRQLLFSMTFMNPTDNQPCTYKGLFNVAYNDSHNLITIQSKTNPRNILNFVYSEPLEVSAMAYADSLSQRASILVTGLPIDESTTEAVDKLNTNSNTNGNTNATATTNTVNDHKNTNEEQSIVIVNEEDTNKA